MNPDIGPALNYREIELERQSYALRTEISREMMEYFANEPVIGISQSSYSRNLVLQIRQDILQHKLETVGVEYPSTWWDAFKERWFPEWLLERYPVEHERRKLEARLILPEIAIPRDRMNWYLHLTEEEVW